MLIGRTPDGDGELEVDGVGALVDEPDLDLAARRVDPAGRLRELVGAARGQVLELDPLAGLHVEHLDVREAVLGEHAVELAAGSQRGASVATTGLPPGIARSPPWDIATTTFSALNVPSNGSGRQDIARVAGAELDRPRVAAEERRVGVDHARAQEIVAGTSSCRRRVNASGTWYRTFATSCTCWPSIVAGRTGSVPQASSGCCPRAARTGQPVTGSNESWSMIERRTRRRCSASLRLEPSKLIGPTTFSDSGKPKLRVGRDRQV